MNKNHSMPVDLNLLRTLVVLLEEGHVTRAAARLHVGQSAVSHALKRLREQFDDPLFIRQGNRMVPTARAEALRPALDEVMREIDRLVRPADFDPATAVGTLRIATSDYGSAVILPHVVQALAQRAPRLSVSYVDLADDTFELLKSGALDLVLSGQESYGGMESEMLFRERFVLVARQDHPCLGREMTVDEFVKWPHVVVDLLHSRLLRIDRTLRRMGRRRTIGVRLPHFLAAPFLAERSDLLVPVPERLAELYASHLGLAVFDPPPELDLGYFDYVQIWHERRTADPVHAWFRLLIADSVSQLNV